MHFYYHCSMRRVSYFPLIILFIVSALLDFYVFQGVKTFTSVLNSGSQQFIHSFYWLASFAVVVNFIINFYRAFPAGGFTRMFNIAFNVFLTLFVTKLIFVLVLFAEDIYRLLAAVFYAYPPRQFWVSSLALALSAIPFFAFIFGTTRGKYYYKVRKTILYLNELPDAFDGFTITQISDVHAGSLDNRKRVQKGIDLINAQNSDLFVFTGDIVNNKASELLPWLTLFKQIKAPYGKFSVLGNHDYGDYIKWVNHAEKAKNLDQLKAHHHTIGFRLLLDEHILIQKDGHSIALLGIENWGLGFGQRGDLNKAVNALDTQTVKILLSHDPSHWDAEVKNHPKNIHLTLSGHTHGMQFGIEFLGFKWSPVKYRYPNWAGLVKENGHYLYVNRGFGFLGFAGRVGIWPEITVIELRKGTA